MTDRLPTIKARLEAQPTTGFRQILPVDSDWLIGEVERLRSKELDTDMLRGTMQRYRVELEEARGEVEDLRTQLATALDGWRTESQTTIERGREIERLRAENSDLHIYKGFGQDHGHQRCVEEIGRLRGLLRELEWVAVLYGGNDPCCPRCRGLKPVHTSNCGLAAALRPTDDPPEGERP